MTAGYWTLRKVKPLGERDNPHGGKLATYACDFEDVAGNPRTNVYWARKPESPVEVGRAYFGEIQDGEKGPRFRTQSPPPDTPLPSTSQPPSQPSGANPRSNPQDDRSARIERQHSQGMALALIAATGDAADLDLTDEKLVPAYLEGVVRRLTDWFQRDVGRHP